MLARNEAGSLPRLLGGLDDFRARGGDLLLADTGSVDDTVAVARQHGCRVESLGEEFHSVLEAGPAAEIERSFAKANEGPLVAAGQRLFHFGDARQQAGMLAANQYVLQLDGGDEVLAMDIDYLDRWIATGSPGSFEYDQYYGRLALRIARFYNRNVYRWEGRVHEILSASVADEAAVPPRIRCSASQLGVRHHKDENKLRNYMAGLALEVLERPQKPRWWHYLGRELYYHRWYESAIAVLEPHAAMENAWPAERSQSLCFVGQCFEALGAEGDARNAYVRAAELEPTRREPLLRLASVHCRRGEFEDAARLASQALAIPRTCAYPEPEANYTWMPHSLLYWSLFWLGRKDEARAHWDTYRALAPEADLQAEHARLFPPSSEGC